MLADVYFIYFKLAYSYVIYCILAPFLLYTVYLHLFIFVTGRRLFAAVIAAVVIVVGLRGPQ